MVHVWRGINCTSLRFRSHRDKLRHRFEKDHRIFDVVRFQVIHNLQQDLFTFANEEPHVANHDL